MCFLAGGQMIIVLSRHHVMLWPEPQPTPNLLNLGVECLGAIRLLTVLFIVVHPGILEERRFSGLPGLGADTGPSAAVPAAAR